MQRFITVPALAALAAASSLFFATMVAAAPVVTTFEVAGPNPVDITATRNAFRAAIGGGTVAGANGSFGGVRREINWDGVPDTRADPFALPADFFNVTSPRGVVFSTPGTGFLVSANASVGTSVLFGFSTDFQAFSEQRLFTAVNSNITDVRFFVPGTAIAATTSAFGVIFTDVEVAGATKLEFFDDSNALIYSRSALPSVNKGLSFLGASFSGASISRVRITSGQNTIVSNGVLGNGNADVVVMDDFIYAEPNRDIPEPAGLALAGVAMVAGLAAARRRRGVPRGG